MAHREQPVRSHRPSVSTRIIADNTADSLGEGKQTNMDPDKYQHSRDVSKNVKRGPHFENTFPAILYNILRQPELSFVITWLSHGHCWKVLNREKMVTDILPLYFNMTKYKSFMRQINGWGFIRVKKGVNKGSYHHANFLYAQAHLIRSMYRICAAPQPKKGCQPSYTGTPRLLSLPIKTHMGRKQAVSTTRTLYQYKSIPNEQEHFCTLPLKMFHCNSPFTPHKKKQEGYDLPGCPKEMTSDSQQRLESFNDQKDCKRVIRRCSKTH